MLSQLFQVMQNISTFILGWPLLLLVTFVSLFCTVSYGFIQLTYFFKAWRFALASSGQDKTEGKASLSPLQAFINSLGMSLGNGALAGVATSICMGGPGALFWLAVAGFLLMAVRFGEVYLSIYYADVRARIGGPVLYLKKLYAGKYLATCYAVCTLLYSLVVGNAIQANAISISVQKVMQVDAMVVAAFFLCFMFYVLSGGAQRILALSNAIVPFKVLLFFSSSFIILGYYWASLLPALLFIFQSAFSSQAVAGATVGYLIQNAMKEGILRSVMASEAGLGTSGILFGSTESKQPMKDAIMSMLTVFISTIVCFLVGLCIVVSGVWNCGLTSTALTIASYETVFGVFGGWLVTILALSFGLGLIVSYAFIAREIWFYLTSNRYELVGNCLYGSFSVIGALCNVYVLWPLGDTINVGMLFLNLIAIVCLTTVVKNGIAAYEKKPQKV